MTEKSMRLADSFYDDDDGGDRDDENDDQTPSPAAVSEVRIVKSKPPLHSQTIQNSSSPTPSSDASEHDITDVSSINESQQQHRFHLESMRNVLLGLSDRSNEPSSPPYYDQEHLNNKHVRISSAHSKRTLDRSYQQPYIHHSTKDQRRIRLTSSALNRQQQQQKIERENLKILERLQKIRPTRSLKRDELLTNYDRLMGNMSYPIERTIRIPSRPSSTTNLSATLPISERTQHISSRPPSATHSISNASVRSRPISANYRSSSAHRPTWNNRWQQQE